MENIKITTTKTVTCPACAGDEKLVGTCLSCKGEGEITFSQDITLAEFRALMNAVEEEE